MSFLPIRSLFLLKAINICRRLITNLSKHIGFYSKLIAFYQKMNNFVWKMVNFA